MEMNPFKPLIQFWEGLYDKKLYIKLSVQKINLKLRLVKATS